MSITVNGILLIPTTFSEGPSQIWKVSDEILDYRG